MQLHRRVGDAVIFHFSFLWTFSEYISEKSEYFVQGQSKTSFGDSFLHRAIDASAKIILRYGWMYTFYTML